VGSQGRPQLGARFPWLASWSASKKKKNQLRAEEHFLLANLLMCNALRHTIGLIGGEEVQTSVKFVKLPSPHPGGGFSKLPCLSQRERVAAGTGEGSVVDRAALLGGLRLLATTR
jgi:hypothetical protein